VRLRELFLREATKPADDGMEKYGRPFNHPEHLVFFKGSSGTIEALNHFKEIATEEEGATTVRGKWDGNPQIYWGREQEGGPLILAGHNQWSRGVKGDSQEAVYDFIANQSGKAKTPEDQKQRQVFAKNFASLYPLFNAATPKDFVGFVYADGLFLHQPAADKEGVYTFCPNPKSQTCYHVRANSPLGKRISGAQVMVVGHAFFPEFGMPDASQKPISDFSQFNSNPQLIVLGPIYNSKPVKIDTTAVDAIEQFAQAHGPQMDGFLQGLPGLGDLKNIIYTYVNQTAKAKQLDSLSPKHFTDWLATSKTSPGKQAKINDLVAANPTALATIFTLVKRIQAMKDDIIDQIEGEQGEIWDTHGEGRVRYADTTKQLGHVKLVPRKRWTPT
jgi:hypothetical protein